ncbi:MAG: sigma-54-dependent Fis family transcriptional regulator [Acidobacteria bacterium]|nr:sigma-54-dependent Fis family transcriptional regulator [Acidobacteriota bacterium]MBS1865964.1 sigma-54-dependent Fis family transcriptional regulator [Acidobacteriota bacterium]
MAATAQSFVGTSQGRILIASGNAEFRRQIAMQAAGALGQAEEAVGGAHALAKLVQFPCDGVLLDRNLPDLDAEEVAQMIRQKYPRMEVQFVDSRTAEAEQDVRASENWEAAEEMREVKANVKCQEVRPSLPGMIGQSEAIQKAYELAKLVAGRETTVLLTGETGTGKEIVARAIHELSPRKKQAFVAVNCAAIPEALLEAELFGHVRGAFTGAVQSRLGRIHVAQGGTLFLDEVGELPLSMQAKLLRFLQNGEVQRLGSSDVYRVDVRVICATNMQLLGQVRAKQFREDLYYRLAVFPIDLPPLRERNGDIALLAEHFLREFCEEAGVGAKRLTPAALGALEQKRWNGNVRELQHVLERAFILSGNSNEVCAQHVQMGNEMGEVREV